MIKKLMLMILILVSCSSNKTGTLYLTMSVKNNSLVFNYFQFENYRDNQILFLDGFQQYTMIDADSTIVITKEIKPENYDLLNRLDSFRLISIYRQAFTINNVQKFYTYKDSNVMSISTNDTIFLKKELPKYQP